MFKPKASLQVTAGERVYQIICDHDSPLTEVIDVLKKILQEVQKLLDDALKIQQENVSKPIEQSAAEEPNKE